MVRDLAPPAGVTLRGQHFWGQQLGGSTMRMLMTVKFPTENGNRAVKDGTLPEVIRKTVELIHPEAAYFTAMDGQRTMIAVFDLKAASDIVRIAEPLYMGLDAAIDLKPCMNVEDLKAGLSSIK
jgi:hypothetical protein